VDDSSSTFTIRAFHEQASGVRNIVRDEIDISEARTVESGRMSVTLTYAARTIHDDESSRPLRVAVVLSRRAGG
jgi:hypothetical protein